MKQTISIGIITDGEPRIVAPCHKKEIDGEGVIRWLPTSVDARVSLLNMKIGDGFHWQSTIQATLPGIVELHANKMPNLINIVDIEDYLLRVAGSEMNIDSPIEFLKAHAIISRSWAYGKIQQTHSDTKTGKIISDNKIITWEDTSDHVGFDVCSDDHCQRYQGDVKVNEKARCAIEETAGIVLCDAKGEIADCRFSKCCGGKTEIFSTCWQDIDFPYLISQSCQYCNPEKMTSDLKTRLFRTCLKDYDARSADYYQWEHKIARNLIIRNLKKYHNIKADRIISLTPLHRGSSGRIDILSVEYTIDGEIKSLQLGKELPIRRLLSESALYSSKFEITNEDDDYFYLHGFGWGHGVGLCQIGAAVMALNGAKYQDILAFYYPGTILKRIENM